MTLDRRDYKSAIPQLEEKINALKKSLTSQQKELDKLDYSAFRKRVENRLVVISGDVVEETRRAIAAESVLRDIVDNTIETWSFAHDPTLSNEPASEWTSFDARKQHVGDVFYNTTSGYAWRFTISQNQTFSWVRLSDTAATKALALAGEKRRVFISQPTVPYDYKDLWSDGNDIKICTRQGGRTIGESFTASDWEITTEYRSLIATVAGDLQSEISNRASAISGLRTDLQGQIDKKIETYYQGQIPQNPDSGDLWCCTSNVSTYLANHIYRYNGSTWEEVQAFSQAIFDKADGKSTIYYGMPQTAEDEDMYVDGDDIYVRVNGAWVKACSYTDDSKANEVADDLQSETTRATSAEGALSDRLTTAEGNIATAQASANGKNTIYYSSSAPTGGTYKDGDTWFDTANGNKIYKRSGSAWVGIELGEDALADLRANKITSGTIDASQVTVSNIDAGNITSGYLSADRINANSLSIGKIDGLQSSLDSKESSFTKSIYVGSAGNPRPVKFCTVDYSDCWSEEGVYVQIKAISGHGNGSSYVFLEDIFISVNYVGTVSVNVMKNYDSSCGAYDGETRGYGDVFWTINTTTKVVDLFILAGQYSTVKSTPFKRLNASTKGTITQLTTLSLYSSGAKIYANNTLYASTKDVKEKTQDKYLTATSLQYSTDQTNWSDTPPSLALSVNQYMREKYSWSDGSVSYGTPYASTLINGIASFVNSVKGDDYTQINGGKIKTGTVVADSLRVGSSAANNVAEAAKTATNYLTADSSGLKVHNVNDSSNYSKISSDGLHVFVGGNEKAHFFSNEATLGGNKAILKYQEGDIQSLWTNDSHRVVLAKSTDESGYANDVTISSKVIDDNYTLGNPVGFVNCTHKTVTANGITTSSGDVRMYASSPKETGGGDVFPFGYVGLSSRSTTQGGTTTRKATFDIEVADVQINGYEISGNKFGVESRTKSPIWTNPSPASNFAAQGVNFTFVPDINYYDFIEVWYKLEKSNDQYAVARCPVGVRIALPIDAHNGGNNHGDRYVTASWSGASFEDAKFSASTDNSRGIPVYIYGIRII